MDEPQKKVGLFDFLRSLTETKENILDETNIKDYSPYMINRFLACDVDLVQLTNYLNLIPNISKEMHYKFLMNSIPKRKRYFKYIKTDKLDNEELLQQAFGYSPTKIKELTAFLSEDDYEQIRRQLETGGIKQQKVTRNRRTTAQG